MILDFFGFVVEVVPVLQSEVCVLLTISSKLSTLVSSSCLDTFVHPRRTMMRWIRVFFNKLVNDFFIGSFVIQTL